MSVFCPDYIFKSVDRITPEFLRRRGITALVLDVDNTLTAHDSQELAPGVARWLDTMRHSGIEMRISSNNVARRVRPFAEKVGLPFVSFSLKPASRGLRLARRAFGVEKGRMALVGDQIFTDTLGANNAGVTPLLVEPIQLAGNPGRYLRYAAETPFRLLGKRRPFL